MIILKKPEDIEVMAEGGRILAAVLEALRKEVGIGVTTKELDRKAFELIQSAGCRSAFFGYKPHGARAAYPATLCTSVNDGVVHGLPSKYRIKDGDLVKLDLGLIHKGFYLDSAVTVIVGEVSKEARLLVQTTEEALQQGIAAARPGNTLGDIGHAIERWVKKRKFSVIEALTGHGIGTSLHEEPNVFNVGRPGRGFELQGGMVIAIEPMTAIGSSRIRQLKDDSFATADGSLSAHFEHTVAITAQGPRVLTKVSGSRNRV